MTRRISTRTVHLPQVCNARYVAFGGVAYRNTAAAPDAPILCQIVPVPLPGLRERG